MGVVENFAKRRTEKQEKAAEEAGLKPEKKDQGPTLREISADKEKSLLFGEYLKTQGDQELSTRFLNGESSADDLDILTEEREKFIEITERSKNLKDRLNKEEIDQLVELSPNLKKAAGHVGADGIHSVIEKHLNEMAINDPDQFADLEKRSQSVGAAEEKRKKVNEAVERIYKAYKLDEKEYLDALDSDDPSAALEKLLRSKIMPFARMFFGEGSFAVDVERLNRREELQRAQIDVDNRRKELGNILKATIYNNEAMRGTFNAVLGDKKIERESTFSIKEVAVLGRKLDAVKQDVLEKDFKEYQSKHPEILDPDIMRERFSEDYVSKDLPKGMSWWAMLSRKIFGTKIKNRIPKTL